MRERWGNIRNRVIGSTLQKLCRENKSEIKAFTIFVMLFTKVAEFFNIAQTKPLEI